MSTKKTSQAQQNQPQQSAASTFVSTLEEQAQRVEAAVQDMTQAQATGLDRAQDAIDEMARLSKQSLEYAAKLTGQWNELVLDAGRKNIALWAPRG